MAKGLESTGVSTEKMQNATSALLAGLKKLMEEVKKKDAKKVIFCFFQLKIQFVQEKQEKCPVVSKEMLTNGKKTDPSHPPSLLVARAGNKFGRTLYKQLRKMGKTGNLVVSPFSLASTLAMLLPGVKGLTLSQVAITCETIVRVMIGFQMEKVLFVPPMKQTLTGFRYLQRHSSLGKYG